MVRQNIPIDSWLCWLFMFDKWSNFTSMMPKHLWVIAWSGCLQFQVQMRLIPAAIFIPRQVRVTEILQFVPCDWGLKPGFWTTQHVGRWYHKMYWWRVQCKDSCCASPKLFTSDVFPAAGSVVSISRCPGTSRESIDLDFAMTGHHQQCVVNQPLIHHEHFAKDHWTTISQSFITPSSLNHHYKSYQPTFNHQISPWNTIR